MERVVHYKEIRIGHLVYGIWILLGGVLYNLGSTYVATTLRDGGVGTVEHACVRIYSLLDSTYHVLCCNPGLKFTCCLHLHASWVVH